MAPRSQSSPHRAAACGGCPFRREIPAAGRVPLYQRQRSSIPLPAGNLLDGTDIHVMHYLELDALQRMKVTREFNVGRRFCSRPPANGWGGATGAALLRLIALLMVVSAILPSAARAGDKTVVLLDQALANADLSLQSSELGAPPYVSVPWRVNNPKWVWAGPDGLVLGPFEPNSFGIAWAFFTKDGSPLELKDGEALRLTFEYSYPQNVGGVINMFRFGLFDSGGGARDLPPEEGFAFPSLRGYTVQTNPQSTQDDGAAIYAENNNGASGKPFTSSGGGLYKKEGEGFPSFDAGAKRLAAQMTISRSGGATTIAIDFDASTPGDAVVRDDVEFLDLSQFDAVGFAHQSTSQPLRIHHVRLEHLSPDQPANP